MGQFKPMVKMETTEPSVILKLKKGGHVNMKKGGKAESGHKKMATGGGALAALAGTPALLGRPAVNAPVQAPGKPSMAMRRQAMMAKKPAMPMGNPNMPAPMKKGGKAEGGDMDLAQDKAMIKKAFKQHDMQEHKGGKGTSLKLKKGGKYASGGAIPSEESYGDYDTTKVYQAKKDTASGTGGVRFGNAGGFKKGGMAKKYASGGSIPSEDSYGDYDTTKVYQAKKDTANGTGGVRNGNAGGFKRGGKAKMATGGVMESNGGGYRKGGATKKAYATGGTVNSGRPVAMPQGRKKPSAPVSINQLAGTFKSGGRATSAEARLLKANAAENASSMRSAKKDNNLKYGPSKRMKAGGEMEDLSNGAYDAHYANEKAENEAMRNMIPNAVKKFGNYVSETFSPSNIAKSFSIQGHFSPEERKQNAATDARIETAKRINDMRQSSGKKRGGRAC